MSETQTILQTKKCSTCMKSEGELLRCSRCKQVYYCSAECQKESWSEHKKCCRKPESKDSTSNVDSIKDKVESSDNKENKSAKKQEAGLDAFGKLKHIGSGNFSVIFKGRSKTDGQIYAIKQIEKAKVQRMRKQADVFMEKHCLNKLHDCPHVVKLYHTFQDELSLFFQMELPSEGQLWQKSKTFGVISDSLYKYYVSHVIKAVSALHNQYQIVHRDLKPENILLDSENKIKLIDFGTAKDLDRPDLKGSGNGLKGKKPFYDYVGTAHYMAPECIHNKASEKKSDIYSLSGVLYFLKVGSPPFQGGSEYLTFTKSLESKIFTCKELFSAELKDLLLKMNEKQMSDRIDINEVMQHSYFKDIDFENLPTYQYSLSQTTPIQSYFIDLSRELLPLLEKESNESVEKRRQIYSHRILPILQRQEQKLTDQQQGNEERKARLSVIKMQCECFLNIRDNTDLSFKQIYLEVNNMKSEEASKVPKESESQSEEETQ